MLKSLLQKILPNPLDLLLKKAQKKGHRRFLLVWNRGLGDIPLGLFAIVHRIRSYIPSAQITFLTRTNLRDGFILLGGVEILVAPQLKRGEPFEVNALLQELNVDPSTFDLIIEHPNPTQWVAWQRGTLTPKLHWQPEWDSLWERYGLDQAHTYVGAHVQTETSYASWRNWPVPYWEELFQKITAKGMKVLLFGFEKTPAYALPGVVDLRGDTPLFSLLSIIKNRCSFLIVPDSGVCSMAYYLNETFPLKLISLWADPNMGILKQAVSSPNPALVHVPLIGAEKQIDRILPEDVFGHIC